MSAGGAGSGAPRVAEARVAAQAKANLFLRVLAREASGYHQLETLFCRLDLADDVRVRVGGRGRSLDCAGDAMPPGGLGAVDRNLAWRAAVAYAEATGWPDDWAIEIDKHVPVGGGLGGGSADAGAVLRCLNALAPHPVSCDALLALAAPLGADVPFLTLATPLALGWGRGERLLALPALPVRPVALVCFPFGVSTRDAYEWLAAERGEARPESRALGVGGLTSWEGVVALAQNDFEAVVGPRYPDIARTLAHLRAGTDAARVPEGSLALLAGSGSTVLFIPGEPAPEVRLSIEGDARVVVTSTAARVVEVEVVG